MGNSYICFYGFLDFQGRVFYNTRYPLIRPFTGFITPSITGDGAHLVAARFFLFIHVSCIAV